MTNKLTPGTLDTLNAKIKDCEFPVPLFKLAASLRANPNQVTRAESKVQLLRFGAANLFAQIDDQGYMMEDATQVSAEEKHKRHGCQKVFFSEGFNDERRKQIAAALLRQVENRGGCEVSPAVESCASGKDCKGRITFINLPDAVQAAGAAFERSNWFNFRVLHSIGMSDQVGEFAEWGMGDLTTNIKKYDKDKSGSICPDEAGDAVLEGGLSAAVDSLSEVFGGASRGMTKKMVQTFSELLSKWKALGDVRLEEFFRQENGRNAEKRPRSAFGSNSLVEDDASPCISLKHLGSPSSESASQTSAAQDQDSTTGPEGGQSGGQGGDHQVELGGAPVDGATGDEDGELGDGVEGKNVDEHGHGPAAAGDGHDLEKAGEGTAAAGQSSQTVNPLDVISQQIAGLRLRKYLRNLLQGVLSDGTTMIQSVVSEEIPSTKMNMNRKFDPKKMFGVSHEISQQAAANSGDRGAEDSEIFDDGRHSMEPL
ncbi:unnamed protein product [Amoebophrya sp. A25]|nr:unnamed protein product [Amoebophrya sp. A25]|eukprot:GSA25T00021063001.1